jgi:hypothetical protein
LLNRVRRIRGQVEAVERAFEQENRPVGFLGTTTPAIEGQRVAAFMDC